MKTIENATLTPFDQIDFCSQERRMYYCLVHPNHADILIKMQGNRRLRHHKVDRFARAMKNNQWGMPATLVQFDTNGRGFNGQHCLHGIKQSGVPAVLKIEVGCSPEERRHCDNHEPKSLADRLDIHPDLAQVLNLATITASGDPKPNPDQQLAVQSQIEEYYTRVISLRPRTLKRPLNSAVVTLGAVVQMMLHEDDQDVILDAYAALVDDSGEVKPCAMANLFSWIANPDNRAKRGGGGQARFRALAYCLTAFDPAILKGNRSVARSMSTSTMYSTVRKAITVPGCAPRSKKTCSVGKATVGRRTNTKTVEHRPQA